jgi:uncharacterized protein
METKEPSSDVAFSRSVKQVQTARGSRTLYERVERSGGFNVEVDDDLRGFLDVIDTAFLATASTDGQPYVQHRGGPRGFIRALDDRTIAFAEYPGNRQYVSEGNLAENARICLFLIDYEERRRVKIWGTAKVVPMNADLEASLIGAKRERGRPPTSAIVITVTAWDINCPQHIPQKLDAEEVATVVERLEEQIAALKRENAALQATLHVTAR